MEQQHGGHTDGQRYERGEGGSPSEARSSAWKRSASRWADGAARGPAEPAAESASESSVSSAASADPFAETAAVYRARPRFPHLPARLGDSLSWLPRARLTALGCALFAVLASVLAGGADQLLLGGSASVYGCLFVVIAALAASWVRPADLVTGPVVAPLAFTAGLSFISDGAGGSGFTGHLLGLFPALAVNAFWLYGGTLLAVLIALVRKLSLVAARRSRPRPYAAGEASYAERGADSGNAPGA